LLISVCIVYNSHKTLKFKQRLLVDKPSRENRYIALDTVSQNSERDLNIKTLSKHVSFKIFQQSNNRISLTKTRRINKVISLLSIGSSSNDLDTNFSNNYEAKNSRVKLFDTSIGSNWSIQLSNFYFIWHVTIDYMLIKQLINEYRPII
jgi:hypothetical protein